MRTLQSVGGILAIFAATSGVNFAKPYPYQCFIYHAGIIWYAIHLICTKQVDLKFKSYIRNLLILVVLIFIMLWVNSALKVYGTNFFYLVKPPVKNLPLLNLKHGRFAYFAVLAVGLLLAITLVHVPALIIQIVKNKRQSGTDKSNGVNQNSRRHRAEGRLDFNQNIV